MGERVASSPASVDPRAARVEAFLVRHVRDHPGLTFGELIRVARLSRAIPRSTAARHLARLVRFGELTLLPDHTYIAGDAGSAPGRALVEVRWQDIVIVVNTDGSARSFMQREFRVVSGSVDHMDFTTPRPLHQFVCWSTAPGRVSRIPAHRAPNRLLTYRYDLAAPLTPRSPGWQHMPLYFDQPFWYRMEWEPPARRTGKSSSDEPDRESESIEVASQGRLFGQRLTPDAYLRLMIVLPRGYPVGAASARVRFQADPTREDLDEEARLAALTGDTGSSAGFRRDGATLALTVPQPRVDRHYEIVWGLPTVSDRSRWLRSQHGG